jgi:integrase
MTSRLESGAKLFKIPDKSSKMIQADCKTAGIDVENGRGKLKFHTLRHSCGTFLASKGVHPKVIQEIMRHKNINLTMSRYTHTLHNQVADAISKISEFSM